MTGRLMQFLLLAAAMVVAVYAAVLYRTASQSFQKDFATYSEALTGDPLEDHWLPDLLPKSARDIHMEYGVDPTFQLLEFTFSPGDEGVITENFVIVFSTENSKAILDELTHRSWRTNIPDHAVVYVPKGDHDDDNEIYLAIDAKRFMAWYSLD